MRKIYLFLAIHCWFIAAYSQFNPAPQSLPYTQDFSSLAHTSTTYPAGWQGWTISTTPGSTFNTAAPTADRALTASSTAATNTGNVHNYNGKIGFLNTGGLDLSIVLSLNTTGSANVRVTYDIMTIRNPYDGTSNTRINEVTLQYRVGNSGTFTNLTGIEYQNNTTTQTTSVTTPQKLETKTIILPAACNNQSEVQIRWASRQVSGAGARPSFAFDNIIVEAVSQPTDYFRSVTSGNWSSTASWESSPDNVTWIPATLVPDQNANTITIRNGHTITVDASVTADQLVVESGATLSVNSALTINDGTGTDLTVNGTLIAAATVTNNGTTNINNIFQINDGGFGGGTDFVYDPAATLVFNNTTIPYVVNGDAYWPAVNGPANVTVQNTGGINMNVPRTVSGLFQTARGVLNGNNLTLNGTVQINANGYFFNAPIYGAASTLIYNTGGTYNRGDEWNAIGVGTIGTTNGYPNNVIVRNNTTINLPNGSNLDRACAGDLTIETGSALYADFGIGGSVNLTVGRDFEMNGNVSLGSLPGGDLHVRRNFTYNSGFFNTNGRAVFFDGPSGDQTITGAVTFAYLIVDKTADNVILNSSISCTQALTLTNGKIVLGANDITLSNDVPGSLSASATAYVVTNGTGTLKRAISTANGNQDYSFPVGSSSNWQPVTLNFPTISANNTIAARFISGAPMGTTGLPLTESGDEIARAANNGYWEVTAASATTDNYTGTFNANGFTDITDYTKVHLIKRADGSSPWTLDGTHVPTTGSNSAAVLQRTGMSGFSQFAVGGKSNLSLPVTLLSFSGYKNGNRNQLSWTTGSEQNNLGFEVQRSTDGVNYTVIGFVNSVATGGNSSDRLSYSFTDNAPAGVKQYYRLRQVDIDGRSKLSNIVLINGTKPAVITLRSIFPNPAADVAQIIIDAPAQAVLTVLVSDMAGRTMMQQIANIAEGSNTVVLPVAALHSGTYLVRVMNEQGEVVTGKLLKQ